jgi:hypothetical protein
VWKMGGREALNHMRKRKKEKEKEKENAKRNL